MFSYWKIIRPNNLLLTVLTQFLFYLAASRSTENAWVINLDNFRFPESITATLACLFIAAGGYVINDIFDKHTDSINKPHKQIAHVEKSAKQLYPYYLLLTAIGLIMGFLTGLGMGILCVAIGVLLYFYSSDFKGEFIMGNLLVSLLAGMVVYIASRGVYEVQRGMFAEFASIAFFLTFGRELIKDIQDEKGDKAQGYQTFAVTQGQSKTKVATGIMITFATALTIWVGVQSQNILFWVFSGVITIPAMAYILYKIRLSTEICHFAEISKWLKITMFVGLLSCLLT